MSNVAINCGSNSIINGISHSGVPDNIVNDIAHCVPKRVTYNIDKYFTLTITIHISTINVTNVDPSFYAF